MLNKLRCRNQNGDTIIEVAIALAILSITLFNAYALSNRSVQLGLAARERGQATQLMQHQAEGLRYLRDSAAEWDDFRGLIPAAAQTFHLYLDDDGDWVRAMGTGEGNEILQSQAFELYQVRISGSFSDGGTKLTAGIEVSWDGLNGQAEIVSVNIVLVDASISPPEITQGHLFYG